MPDLPRIPKEEIKEIVLLSNTTAALLVKDHPEEVVPVGAIMDTMELLAQQLGVEITDEDRTAAYLLHVAEADLVIDRIKKVFKSRG